jgi:hypothetical protein
MGARQCRGNRNLAILILVPGALLRAQAALRHRKHTPHPASPLMLRVCRIPTPSPALRQPPRMKQKCQEDGAAPRRLGNTSNYVHDAVLPKSGEAILPRPLLLQDRACICCRHTVCACCVHFEPRRLPVRKVAPKRTPWAIGLQVPLLVHGSEIAKRAPKLLMQVLCKYMPACVHECMRVWLSSRACASVCMYVHV